MRRKPNFKPDSSRSHNEELNLASCLWMLFVIIGGYFVMHAIFRVSSGQGNKLDHIICYGVLIGLIILVILAILQENRDKEKLRKAQQEWKRKCKSVEVAIVNRKYYPGRSWDDGYGISRTSHSSYELNLELTAEQRVLFPNLSSVSVTVNKSIYSKIIDRNVVCVYYQAESPMTFLLEEETE
jgi:hypothetical protein